MKVSPLLIGAFGLFAHTQALNELDASAVVSGPRFNKVMEWTFPKKITCTLEAAIEGFLATREIYSSTILRAVQDKKNHNLCIENTLKAERGTQDCTLTFTPETHPGDPKGGWRPLDIDYTIWGKEPTATKFKFDNGNILHVSAVIRVDGNMLTGTQIDWGNLGDPFTDHSPTTIYCTPKWGHD